MFPQLFGKYVLEREIAAGGMAKVFLATLRGAVGFEKRLVVKQIRPELASDEAFVKRFVEEAKTAVELGHPNIVPVYELGVEQGVYYIAMEHCEGVTLSEVLGETGPFSAEEGAYLGIEICRALDYAHRRASIVHRDVTPRNVMLDEEGAVRIIDFGIAAPVTLPDDDGSARGERFGSPGHMAPEQIAGDALSPATDVFAVAVLLTEAWTGRPPYRRSTAAECVTALAEIPPPLDSAHPDLSPLAELIASALSKDPEARPQSAEQLARPLREFVKSADLGDLARRLGTRVRRTRRKLLASSPWLLGEGMTGAEQRADETPARRPRAPSIGDTQTFAVRNDLVEWTRKLPSVAPPPDDAVVEPAPASEAMSTRPIVVSERDADAEDDGEEAPGLRGAGPSDASEPVATSADEPGVRREPHRASRPLISLALVAFVASVLWWGSRTQTTRTTDPPPLVTSSPRTASAPPSASQAPLPSATASAKGTASAPPVAPPLPSGRPVLPPTTASAPPGAADGSVGEAKSRATLTLTASPPSSVSVGGKGYGTTPVTGVQLPPGKYFVSFENSTLGLRTGAQVTLGAGGARTVHADFTDQSPRVIVR
jgi:serine/threonine-protein kinase